MKDPLVSVLVSNYNYDRFLKECVESAYDQTYPHFEVIVCDDGSSDGSRALLERLEKSILDLQVVYQDNKGQGGALTSAYERSKGSILCLLDADDLFLPNKLAEIVATFNFYPDVGLVGHRLIRVDVDGRPIGMLPAKGFMLQGDLSDEILQRNSVPGMPTTSGLALDRKLAEVIFPISSEITRDVDEAIRRIALSLSPMRSIEKPLGLYRVHQSNDSVSALDLSRIDSTIRLYRSINTHHRESLARVDVRLAGRVVLVGNDPDVASLEFVRARLTGQGVKDSRSRLLKALRDGRVRRGRVLFWGLMAGAPMPLFRWGLVLFKSQKGIKVRIGNILRPYKRAIAAVGRRFGR